MSKKKQKERKERNRKERVKQKLLRRRTAIRAHRKLEKELEDIKRLQADKLEPFVKNNDT
jgi:hypothetical protein